MKNTRKLFLNTALIKSLSITLLLFIGSFQSIVAQEASQPIDTTIYVEVNLKEGASILGELITEEESYIQVKSTSLGELKIDKSNIDNYKIISKDRLAGNEYFHPTVNTSRSIFMPTGYGLKKGEGYYQNFMIIINQISYGFTDHFSMGVGFEVVSVLSGLNNTGENRSTGSMLPAFMLTPKFSIPMKDNNWNVGIGGIALHIPDSDRIFDLGGVYGVSTWGPEDSNISLGVGMTLTEEGVSKRPLITISATHRLTKRIALVSENWIVNLDDERFITNSVGARYLGDRIAVDFALVGVGVTDGISGDGLEYAISPIPLVGLTIPFGKGWKK